MNQYSSAGRFVPLKWYNWIPSLGGRSVWPILDRIDVTTGLALKTELAFFICFG
jgi:hypothetical protein